MDRSSGRDRAEQGRSAADQAIDADRGRARRLVGIPGEPGRVENDRRLEDAVAVEVAVAHRDQAGGDRVVGRALRVEVNGALAATDLLEVAVVEVAPVDLRQRTDPGGVRLARLAGGPGQGGTID